MAYIIFLYLLLLSCVRRRNIQAALLCSGSSLHVPNVQTTSFSKESSSTDAIAGQFGGKDSEVASDSKCWSVVAFHHIEVAISFITLPEIKATTTTKHGAASLRYMS
jgi:hypothetical protein